MPALDAPRKTNTHSYYNKVIGISAAVFKCIASSVIIIKPAYGTVTVIL